MLQGFPCRWKLRIVVFGEILLNEFFFKTGGAIFWVGIFRPADISLKGDSQIELN